jgi:hypothetical protein
VSRLQLQTALLLVLSVMPGCGLGLLQTARTTPKGSYEISAGLGYLHNELVPDRGMSLSNLPVQLGVRRGLRDDLDVGVQLFFGAGVLVDAKYNLMPPASRLALSLSGGVGGGYNLGGGGVIHVPLRLLASYDLWHARIRPYAAAGYGTFWVLGYGEPEPSVRYAARKGHGDGVLALTAGVSLGTQPTWAVEYSFWTQVLDDPGDFYSFVDNHILLAGVRW